MRARAECRPRGRRPGSCGRRPRKRLPWAWGHLRWRLQRAHSGRSLGPGSRRSAHSHVAAEGLLVPGRGAARSDPRGLPQGSSETVWARWPVSEESGGWAGAGGPPRSRHRVGSPGPGQPGVRALSGASLAGSGHRQAGWRCPGLMACAGVEMRQGQGPASWTRPACLSPGLVLPAEGGGAGCDGRHLPSPALTPARGPPGDGHSQGHGQGRRCLPALSSAQGGPVQPRAWPSCPQGLGNRVYVCVCPSMSVSVCVRVCAHARAWGGRGRAATWVHLLPPREARHLQLAVNEPGSCPAAPALPPCLSPAVLPLLPRYASCCPHAATGRGLVREGGGAQRGGSFIFSCLFLPPLRASSHPALPRAPAAHR